MFGINKYALIGAAIVVAGLITTIGALNMRITAIAAERNAAQLEAKTLRGERDALLTAVSGEADAREKIRTALARCVGVAQEIERSANEAQAQARAAITARDRARADLRAELEKANATDPSCAAWSRDSLCPAASHGVRRIWQLAADRGGEAGDRRSGAQAAGAAAGVAHDAPAVATAPDPGRLSAADCYSNAQLYDALETVLNAYGQSVDQFNAIERMQHDAIEAANVEQR